MIFVLSMFSGRITNLQYTAQDLTYIVCGTCIGVYIELYISGIVIVIPHLYPLLLPVVCGLE